MNTRRWLCIAWLAATFGVERAALRAGDPPQEFAQRILDLAYVDGGHERQKLDLYLPSGEGPWPVLVWIHGGAWLGGSKAAPPVLALALRHGFAVASVNYRLSQHAPFPAQVEDCKAAIRWLRANASEYRLEPRRVGVWGASAGGHLAALLGTAGSTREFEVGACLDQSSAVQCVVDFFGPTDFLKMNAQRLPGTMDHDGADSPESRLVGGAIQEHPEAVRRASPLTYVTAGAPPFLIVHGDRDPLVPHAQSVLLLELLREAGVSAELYTVQDGGHGGFTDPNVQAKVEAFLLRHLKSPSAAP